MTRGVFLPDLARRQWRAFLRVARRLEDDERDAGIARMITAGQSWNSIRAHHRLQPRHHLQDREAREGGRIAAGPVQLLTVCASTVRQQRTFKHSQSRAAAPQRTTPK